MGNDANWVRLIETWDVLKSGYTYSYANTEDSLIETWDVLKCIF